ncbi:hypothetical protein Cantr_03884 [Candida viswanathii]|uniref:Uncharacterized protein n=1 Tax=Candida viswanathii TaxID=5486 RepID=A0A367XLC1_9ASCO|nr:hypothetical protein Cantr_03884 [Candida viswanathii]
MVQTGYTCRYQEISGGKARHPRQTVEVASVTYYISNHYGTEIYQNLGTQWMVDVLVLYPAKRNHEHVVHTATNDN